MRSKSQSRRENGRKKFYQEKCIIGDGFDGKENFLNHIRKGKAEMKLENEGVAVGREKIEVLSI